MHVKLNWRATKNVQKTPSTPQRKTANLIAQNVQKAPSTSRKNANLIALNDCFAGS